MSDSLFSKIYSWSSVQLKSFLLYRKRWFINIWYKPKFLCYIQVNYLIVYCTGSVFFVYQGCFFSSVHTHTLDPTLFDYPSIYSFPFVSPFSATSPTPLHPHRPHLHRWSSQLYISPQLWQTLYWDVCYHGYRELLLWSEVIQCSQFNLQISAITTINV